MYIPGSKKQNFLTNNDLSIWYDQIFLPSLKEINCPIDILHHYPPTFKAYYLKSKKDNGTCFNSPYPLPQIYLSSLSNTINTKINSTPHLSKFQNYFYHIYSKNIKLYTKFNNLIDIYDIPLSFIYSNFSLINTSWKENAKIDLGIEFIPNDISSFNSIYWSRNSVINLLQGIGVTFSTNISTSRIDHWAHTYDISGAAGEAKTTGYQNGIYYAQAYHIEKEPFSSLTATLLAKLNENDAIRYPQKIQEACNSSISILNEITNTNYGARLEYRIKFENIHQITNIIIHKLSKFLETNSFYIIPTDL
ncbi:677_t:CDS:1, partial [Cetraspora pellucida]